MAGGRDPEKLDAALEEARRAAGIGPLPSDLPA